MEPSYSVSRDLFMTLSNNAYCASRPHTVVKIFMWAVVLLGIFIGGSVLASSRAGASFVEQPIHQTSTTLTRGRAYRAFITPVSQQVEENAEDTELTPEQEPVVQHLNDWQYIDMDRVRDTWLQWTNYLRVQQLGLTPYDVDRRLNLTAQHWSDLSAKRGSISHRRSASDGYYNYNGLVSWFKNTGKDITGDAIVFQNVNRATFSESIGWGYYSCNEADCTDEVIEATRSTWNFFYGERSYNGVHYRALTHKNFGIQGLGLTVSGKKYFLTIHYGTEIVK